MFKETVTYEGTITGPRDYEEVLKDMGVTYEKYADGVFQNCVVPPEVVDALDPLWGVLYWSLARKTEVEEI